MTQAILEKLNRELRSIWSKPPVDIERIKGTRGANGNYFNFINYAEADSRILGGNTFLLTRLCLQDKVPLKSLVETTAALLEGWANGYTRSYQFAKVEYLPSILKEVSTAIAAVKDKQEYLKIIEALTLVISRYNYWLEAEMPWADINVVYVAVARPRPFPAQMQKPWP